MKFNNLIKSTPFLSTLLLIIFLCFSNQKENTKLRILIWDTPSLTLGTYLAISTGTGFIISYIITNSLAISYQNIRKKSLRFKDEIAYEESNEINEIPANATYDNTLIERDIKDPSPTINASFRIIGRTEQSKTNLNNDKKAKFDDSFDFEDQYDELTDQMDTSNQIKSITTDWNDDSYSNW